MNAVVKTVKVNKLKSCYIRPFFFRGYGAMGLYPIKNPVLRSGGMALGVLPGRGIPGKGDLGSYFLLATTRTQYFPMLAKAGGNYLNSQLMKMEAVQDEFDEAIALDHYGYVSEGSGENVFMVKNGVIFTPPIQLGHPGRHHTTLDFRARQGPGHRNPPAGPSARGTLHCR